jgi:hypothetical protein
MGSKEKSVDGEDDMVKGEESRGVLFLGTLSLSLLTLRKQHPHNNPSHPDTYIYVLPTRANIVNCFKHVFFFFIKLV